ncbi:MAG: hypothetical protein FJ253_08115 [Phycisphaerae bacterium]|nr:hypothetical protein [Phycisphaerae bacterium]
MHRLSRIARRCACIAACNASAFSFALPPVALTAPDPMPLDFFGSSVAADGDRIVVASPMRQPVLKGRLFFFALRDGAWSSDGTWDTNWTGDGLGRSLALSGSVLIAGAPMRKESLSATKTMMGRAHVLQPGPSGWTPVHDIAPSSGGSSLGHLVGQSVATDGAWCIVGEPGAYRVHFVRIDDGQASDKSHASPGGMAILFGSSVAIAGEWAAVGRRTWGPDVMLLRLQEDQTWQFDASIESAADPSARFGEALAMRDDLLAISAPAPFAPSQHARGTVHLLHRIGDAWFDEATLEAPLDLFCEGFGRAIAIGDDRVAVGAVAAIDETAEIAAVFVFRRTVERGAAAWTLTNTLVGSADEDFGASLAFAGSRLVVGVPGATVDGVDAAGAALIFDLINADLDGDGVVDGADLGELLGAWGAAKPGAPADFNGDGVVDGDDLGTLLAHWS